MTGNTLQLSNVHASGSMFADTVFALEALVRLATSRQRLTDQQLGGYLLSFSPLWGKVSVSHEMTKGHQKE